MILFAALTYIVFLIATGFFRNSRRTVCFAIGFLLLAIPVFQVVVLANIPMRGFLHFQKVSVFGAMAVSATYYFLAAILRLRPASAIQQINVVGNFFLMFLYLSLFSSVIVNSHFDRGSAREETVLAEGKEVVGGGGSELFLVTLASWREDRVGEAIPVTKEEYDRTVVGQSRFFVSIRPGRLGLEWIDTHQLLEGSGSQ